MVETAELYDLLARFLGPARASEVFDRYARDRGGYPLQADSRLIHYTERLLAGAIGAASARVMISSIVMGEVLSIEEVMTIADESTQVIESQPPARTTIAGVGSGLGRTAGSQQPAAGTRPLER